VIYHIPSQRAKQLGKEAVIAATCENNHKITSVTDLEYLNILSRNELLLYDVLHYVMKWSLLLLLYVISL
jgi:hypothetical protein